MEQSDYINFTPVPRICSGWVTSKIKDSEIWEVQIYESPIGEFHNPIYCQLIYTPGDDYNIKQGDYVKVLITFLFGGPHNRYTDTAPGTANFILGTFNESSYTHGRVENPNSEYSDDSIRFINKKNGAGVCINDYGHVTIASGGSIFHTLKPFGYGVDQNSERSVAQNHQRIVGYNPPFYLTRENFGLYSGSDRFDSVGKISEKDFYINYRRFVQETRDVDNWISTCEGFFAPWVGANNNLTSMTRSKNTIFDKIINQGKSRLTMECGESDNNFVNIRVDDVKINEQAIPSGSTPATLGNRFKVIIGNNGAFDLYASGEGVPRSNFHGFKISINKDGELFIFSKGKITFSHSENDLKTNSIILDPKNGIDLKAVNGVRVNGQEVILKAFIDWMNKNQAQLCQATSMGGPTPIHPLALPDFNKGVQTFGEQGGFASIGKGSPASGIIKDEDNFNSV